MMLRLDENINTEKPMTITPDLHVGLPFLEGLCADLRNSIAIPENKPARLRCLLAWQTALRTALTIVGGVTSAALALLEFSPSL